MSTPGEINVDSEQVNLGFSERGRTSDTEEYHRLSVAAHF